MSGPAIRSRVLELQRSLAAARHGRELLDQKREALQRELSARLVSRAERFRRAARSLNAARRALPDARVEIGRRDLAVAGLAQTPHLGVSRTTSSLVGVRLPRLTTRERPFRLRYTLSNTAASVDRAAFAFASALGDLVVFAEEEATVRHLQRGLARTTRRLNALDLLVIPEIRKELREVAAAVEEEERDETLRRKRWLASRAR